MAAVTTSAILAKLGKRLDAHVQKHSKDETNFGFQRLPPGITGGVAKLVACGFGVYKTGPNKDKVFFRAAGSCIEPRSVQVDGREVVVAGSQTSIMEPLCDTKGADGTVTTEGDHMATILNHIRVLCNDSPASRVFKTLADVEGFCKSLEKMGTKESPGSKPLYFKFSTSKRAGREYLDAVTKQRKKSADGTWENWHGSKGLEDYTPPASAKQGMTQAPQANGAVSHVPPPAPTGGVTAVATEADEAPAGQFDEFGNADVGASGVDFDADAPEVGSPEDGSAVPSLDDLFAAAEAGDPAADDQLLSICLSVGITEDQKNEAATWADLRTMMDEALAGTEQQSDVDRLGQEEPAADEPAPEPEPAPTPKPKPKAATLPKLNSMWGYVRIDPKTKQPLVDPKTKKPRKPVEVQVTAIDAQTRTVTIKQVDDPKVVVKGVSIDKLLPLKS